MWLSGRIQGWDYGIEMAAPAATRIELRQSRRPVPPGGPSALIGDVPDAVGG